MLHLHIVLFYSMNVHLLHLINIGVKITNGISVEWLNCFNYFASIGIQGVQGATGKSGSGKLD